MSQVDPTLQKLEAEVCYLRQELQMRDQLVQQLSGELFRLIRDQPRTQQSGVTLPKAMQSLQNQFQVVKQQLALQRQEVSHRDAELAQIRQAMQELNKRNNLLEQAIQEIPEVYRQRFAERISPVKQKLGMLQRENRQLHARLENISFHLAVKRRHPEHVELPQFDGHSVHHAPTSPTSLTRRANLEDV